MGYSIDCLIKWYFEFRICYPSYHSLDWVDLYDFLYPLCNLYQIVRSYTYTSLLILDIRQGIIWIQTNWNVMLSPFATFFSTGIVLFNCSIWEDMQGDPNYCNFWSIIDINDFSIIIKFAMLVSSSITLEVLPVAVVGFK